MWLINVLPISGAACFPVPSMRSDILILGAGLAGLFLGLRLAPHRVRIVSPTRLGLAAASAWAQGGMAAALSPEDSPEAHAADTIAAGAGLVDPVIARILAQEGPARVRDLLALGVPFDRSPDGSLSLSLEAAHSMPRVARVAGDLAGKAIMASLTEAARAADHIEILEGYRAESLISDAEQSICGAVLCRGDGTREAIQARHIVLALGGSGGLWRLTTNPREAQGQGMAMAYQAGALIADPEFVQFHPTAMDLGVDPAPLATEALRGEGAILRDSTGRDFMRDYDPRGGLAPRDIVARAIGSEIAQGRHVFLDARQAIGKHFPDHFPSVFAACMAANIDPRLSPIPVAPAAHYHMGGIVTDIWGQTSLKGLWACGECASTGAHGANRLASNSLLEAVVFADRIARALGEDVSHDAPSKPAPRALSALPDAPPSLPDTVLQALRAGMTRHAGIVRDKAGLSAMADEIVDWRAQHGSASPLVAAALVVHAALAREESRGGHYRADFPQLREPATRSFWSKDV